MQQFFPAFFDSNLYIDPDFLKNFPQIYRFPIILKLKNKLNYSNIK